MIRHVEFIIEDDFTTWGQDEDFEGDTYTSIKETLDDFIADDSTELLSHIQIKKVWYEEG